MTLDLRQFKDALDRYLTMPPEDEDEQALEENGALFDNQWIANRHNLHIDAMMEHGRVAYECGEPVDSNPWEEWQPEYRLWRDGWENAAYEAGSLAATDPDVAVGRGDTPEYIDGVVDTLLQRYEETLK